ncbi:membrane-associated kinase regulator 1 [Hibiscus trionum]|uniref:Membrane-associated kinase regulator 1 n=1 Tax=Hibiscus trionum TaxID=183268 RepID=A0A9W7MA35_HIBTR|nr:membrane-associated kinase regulator 1 [Hibiscus trionum]
MAMGKRREKLGSRSQTLPSSPSHSFSSSSSSDFEFTISRSPHAATADDLFYKGQLLPLHLSPRLSMVRTLLLSSSSSSSTATASRDSTASSSNDSRSSFASDLLLLAADNCGSSRPSSVSEDNGNQMFSTHHHHHQQQQQIKKNKYFSLSRFSSMFNKENNNNNKHEQVNMAAPSSSVKKISITAKRVISKYLKKVKPLYEKLSHKQVESVPDSFSVKPMRSVKESNNGGFSHSFSGNLRYPRRRSCISSCPSSMRSSPSHSGVISRNGFPMSTGRVGGGMQYPDQSSMEELQSAIQGAIAHCKNSLLQNKTTVIGNQI